MRGRRTGILELDALDLDERDAIFDLLGSLVREDEPRRRQHQAQLPPFAALQDTACRHCAYRVWNCPSAFTGL